MFSFINFKNKIFILVLALGIIIFLTILLVQNPQNNLIGPPSPTPFTSPKVYPFLKTEPGKTTESELDKLPGLKYKKAISSNESQYSFSSPLLERDDIVITKNGIVAFERQISVLTGLTHPNISEFINRYGQPENEVIGSSYYGEHEKTYIYAFKGFSLIANPFTGEVDEIHSFTPMSNEDYIRLWGQDIKSQPTKEDL